LFHSGEQMRAGTVLETASLTITMNHSRLYIKRNWVTPYRWTWCVVRQFTMGEIFPNHGVLTMLTMTWLALGACVSSRAFLLTHLQTVNVWLFNIYLEMNWEYKIYSSQKFSSNHSRCSQTSSSMVVLRTGRVLLIILGSAQYEIDLGCKRWHVLERFC
jgi:hypothetical protein